MLSIIIFLLISVANTQYINRQQQYPSNNFNSWSSLSTWNQNAGSVRGNLIGDGMITLPYGSKITVSLVDSSLQDTASRPLNTFVRYGSYRFPIPFEIPYSITAGNNNNYQQYTIQARIENGDKLLYINDQYTPVQLNQRPVNPVNVMMKLVENSIYPGNNGGIYSTVPPIINNAYICQLRADPGPCYASISQYYFDAVTRSCQSFTYGGCAGNRNRFSSMYECQLTCPAYRRRDAIKNAKQKWMN